ncbi:isocitrate dehydrogenase [Isosphaera pallida ATCC 43644]|uniref:Isocitrate dehydrogenase [NADP] n=1 Tax=Isosphaera pallida (strain ATCC 43644 / DSM 9630 / IS1B) TaxID=575540 RepID=E8R149_ISOPI|nr:NADP-dependent isocitrate dehydrogenase [Isosphaera pallida]ADV63400.1 isocitrate dehydrogenase [Isosphaera pallida ATCC 43644]
MGIPITVAYGDGIGPEIMAATLIVLKEAGADLEPEVIEIGESIYQRGVSSGIEPTSWESLRRTGVFLKSPVTTPQGGGFKSLNVTIRKGLGLYANVRPCQAYAPFVRTLHPRMDLVIIRENEEDLYAGIEHRQTDEVMQCLKLISRPGCERIVRYAFEFARAHGRTKVTCMTKDNIMKLTDGLFHQVFDEIGRDYPELKQDHLIIDIGAARLADTPEIFDVIVTPNLYGDILSDIAAQVAGSVGLAGSANIGDHGAMFEAIHGSAPTIAGKNLANPSGLLQAAVMMLVHLGLGELATTIRNAWLRTLEDGLHTADIAGTLTKTTVGTLEFAQAVVERLGQRPERLKPASFEADNPDPIPAPAHPPSLTRAPAPSPAAALPAYRRAPETSKTLVGVDLFLNWREGSPEDLGRTLSKSATPKLTLCMITNRGVKVWPNGLPETFCTDHWRCRFMSERQEPIDHRDILELYQRVIQSGFDVIKTENLCLFDGVPGFALGQGQ